jgi:hypothetical protein
MYCDSFEAGMALLLVIYHISEYITAPIYTP